MFMESLMHLILPFRWKSKYSTVLPSNKIDYLKTPGTFLYGVHSRHTKDVEKVANLVIVDVDNGNVITTDQNLCKREHTKSKGAKRRIQLPNIPTQIANLFVDKMSQVNRKFALSGTLRPNSFKNSKEHNLEIKKRILDQNKCITSICQELIADLFSDVLLNLQPKRRYFDKGSFLEKHVSDKDFYERVFQTKMFETFLEEQMKGKTDYWLEIIRQRDLMSLTRSNESRYALSHDETFCEQSTEEELKVLYLENFTKLENHTENIKLQISNKLESLCDCEEKASLYYIRAMFKYAIDENMDALKDFIDMLITNVRILPIQIVSELYSRLTEEEEEEFMNLPGHKHILYFIKENNERKEERYRIKMEPLKTPDSDLDFCMLEEIVLLNDMSNNNKTIRGLFDALSVVESKSSADEIVHTKVVKQATFWKLKRCWDYNRIQCKKIKLERHILSDEETILKISTGCQTDFGYGRIGLTDRRLFFLNDVTNQYQEIAKLRKIKAIEKVDMNGMFYGVLNGVQALKIITEGVGTNSFTIHFNEERNLLYLVIREMWAGKVVAQAMKDVMMVQHAIQNTLLIDAVIASGHDECSTHFMKSEIVAVKLSYFYELYLNGTHHLSDNTKDALRMKIDVNFGEKDQKTVYSLLYTGGEGNISQPKLWCGLRDGIIKVYNALTWLLDRVIYLELRNACIACLTPVDKSHVWVGSAGIHNHRREVTKHVLGQYLHILNPPKKLLI
ncbi:DENN domain-containing protein 3-like [Ruditapes philippinarum]|uniref:DENN domain-containing protein 3-like n=1 Tax=Ruditapes philippinarum TaxID=129788 RepID=UPI00295B7DE8|nr:DENN domain-containing protein 3-like [Ruditapes philippinarum]